MNKHTPGPWALNPIGRNPIVGFDCGDGGALLPLVHSVHGFDEKVAMANARLIAAAPELLEACQSLLELTVAQIGECFCLDTKGRNLGQCRQCDAKDAIAKATGQ